MNLKCYVESEDNFYNYPISLEDIKNMKEKKIKNEIKNIKKRIYALRGVLDKFCW